MRYNDSGVNIAHDKKGQIILRLGSVARECSRRARVALLPRRTSGHDRRMEAKRWLRHPDDLSSGAAYHRE